MSRTVTVKLPVDVLPCLSVDVQLTVVVVEPTPTDAGTHVTGVVTSTMSVAVAV